MSEITLAEQLHQLQARAVLLAARDGQGRGIYEADVLEAVNPDEIRALADKVEALESVVETLTGWQDPKLKAANALIAKLEAALRDLLMVIQNTAGLLVGSITTTQLDELMLGVKAAGKALDAEEGVDGE